MDAPSWRSRATRRAIAAVDRGRSDRPDHLVDIPDTDWALWRWVAVRGAGFPASLPAMLAMPGSAALADALLQAEADVQAARDAALERLERQLRESPPAGRRPIVEAIRRLKAGKADAAAAGGSPQARLRSAREDFRREFVRDTRRVSDALCGLAADDRLREALAWQNRRAIATCLEPLLRNHRRGGPRRSDDRKHEETLASYLQRYCLKNDTIGFFGPIGWAAFAADGPALAARPGTCLLAERNVYFEVWCIDALAERLLGDERMAPWLVPRRAYAIHVDGSTLLPPDGVPIELAAVDAALLHACDGEKTVRQIALDAMQDPSLGLGEEQEVLARLRQLRDREFVSLTWALPMDLHPERALERLLRRIGDDRLREEALAALGELQQARDRVAAAGGDAQELDRALEDLDDRFTRITGRAPTRSAGKMYAARTLVFEDCRRDIDVTIGREILEAMAGPLALVLASARWLTADMACRYMAAFEKLYREMAASAGDRAVSLADFLDRLLPLLLFGKAPLAGESRAAFQERWARILDLDADRRRVEYRSDELRPRVLAEFDGPAPGWPGARYHSPDMMIAARSLDDLRRGDYLLVMGEMHVASNTLGWAAFLAQHPCGEALLRATDADLPEARLEPVLPRSFWPGQTARAMPALFSPKDYRLELSADACGADGSKVLPLGSLIVCEDLGRLVVRTRDGRLQFDLAAVVGQALSWQAARRFNMVAPLPHCPRITFDRLVVVRESWSFGPEEIGFALERDEPARFVAARRFARARGLPRRVFVSAPIERKPFYVDFDSATYVNVFSKVVRRSLEAGPEQWPITVVEMLPEADEAWLVDAEGVRYTCELRMVALDRTVDCGAAEAAV